MIQNKYYNIGDNKKKIALITDIHFDAYYDLKIFNMIIDNLKENKPDYICLVGDIIDHMYVIKDKEIDYLKNFIIDLSKIASTIINLGNHDISYKNKEFYFDEVNKWFLNLKLENVYYLNNKSLIRDNLCFTGFNLSCDYYKNKEKKDILIKELEHSIDLNRKYYNILLCHSPINILKNETIEKSDQIKKVDLILSGHMHNGMVFKIFDRGGNRGFVGPYNTFFPKYARNKVTKKIDGKEVNMIICGGIIKVSNTNFKIFKFLNKIYPIHIDYINI